MAEPQSRPKKAAGLAMISAVGMLMVMQLVPYGHDHSNPAVVREPNWSDTETRTLAVRACFDCHSNETRWPWYSHIAPASWLVQYDVNKGRQALNFSEWHKQFKEAEEAAESVIEKEMPPRIYLPLHKSAQLTLDERSALTDGLRATLGHQAFDD